MKKLILIIAIVFSGMLILASCSQEQNKSLKSGMSQDQIDPPQKSNESETIKSVWEKDFFKDNFGDNTNDAYIVTKSEGIFSNSAANNDLLFVEIIVTKGRAGIFLHEYRKSYPAEKLYMGNTVKMKNSKGEVASFSMSEEWHQKGGMEANRNILIHFLAKSVGDVKFYIEAGHSATYNFNIDATGFTKALKSL